MGAACNPRPPPSEIISIFTPPLRKSPVQTQQHYDSGNPIVDNDPNEGSTCI